MSQKRFKKKKNQDPNKVKIYTDKDRETKRNRERTWFSWVLLGDIAWFSNRGSEGITTNGRGRQEGVTQALGLG